MITTEFEGNTPRFEHTVASCLQKLVGTCCCDLGMQVTTNCWANDYISGHVTSDTCQLINISFQINILKLQQHGGKNVLFFITLLCCAAISPHLDPPIIFLLNDTP